MALSLKTGGELLAETLRAAGVSKAFALHGGHLEALFKACLEENIDLIDCRHEAAAGHAADAYARSTGSLGVCMITAGPGFTNAIAAIANAKLDASPTLFIIGAPPAREVETNPLQGGVDQIAIARPVSKWAISVPSTDRIADLTAMAIRKARTGANGPVVLEVPIDVLHMTVPANRATPPAGVNVRPVAAPTADALADVAALLASARRPIVIAGLEAVSVTTAHALRRFADATCIPVLFKTPTLGLLPPGHPANAGPAGNLALLPAIGQQEPDLVILLGGRMGLLLGGRSGALVPDAAKLVQVHADPGEIGRIRDVDVAISADCAEVLDGLTAALASVALPDFSPWQSVVVSTNGIFATLFPDRETGKSIHPYHAAKAVAEAAGPEAAYVLDGGEAASWAGSVLDVDGPGRVLTHGYFGCLGIGPGFAIGAQVAHPDRRVVHVTGDGAMGFHIQEFDTMVRHNLPIVTVVINNQVWGMSIHGQQIMYGANYHAITKIEGTNYANIASGFGCHGERVTRFDDIGPAMERAFASGKPALVEIMTDADVVHPVTVSMLGNVEEGSADVMIPYYENIVAVDA